MTGAPFEVVTSACSDIGCVREINEDSVCVVSPGDPDELQRRGVLLVIADGMGGHSAGEVASRIAAEVVHRRYFGSIPDVEASLIHAFVEANRMIFEEAARRPQMRGMGTTCTALALRGGQAYWAHVGDSRLYLVRGGRSYQLTQDHSAVAMMVAAGEISREQARHHADKNVLIRALGTRLDLDVDSAEPLDVVDGDRFLLTTDGLHDLLTDEELDETASAGTPSDAVLALVEAARARGGPDNITVALAEIRRAGRETASKETGVWQLPGNV